MLFLTFLGIFILLGLFLLEVGFYYLKRRLYFILYGISLGIIIAIIYLLFNIKFIPSYRYWQILLIGSGFGLFYTFLILVHVRYKKLKYLDKISLTTKLPKSWIVSYTVATFVLFSGSVLYWLINFFPLHKTLTLEPNTKISLSYFRPIEHRFPTVTINFKDHTAPLFKENNLLEDIQIDGSIDNQSPQTLTLSSDTPSKINLYITQKYQSIPIGFHHLDLSIQSLPQALRGQQVTIRLKPMIVFKFISKEPIYRVLRLWIYWPTLLGLWILISLWIILRSKNR